MTTESVLADIALEVSFVCVSGRRWGARCERSVTFTSSKRNYGRAYECRSPYQRSRLAYTSLAAHVTDSITGASQPFPANDTQGLVFLDETGTPDYLSQAKIAEYKAALAAGRNASFPIIFGLAGVLFRRTDYFDRFDKDFRALKIAH